MDDDIRLHTQMTFEKAEDIFLCTIGNISPLVRSRQCAQITYLTNSISIKDTELPEFFNKCIKKNLRHRSIYRI